MDNIEKDGIIEETEEIKEETSAAAEEAAEETAETAEETVEETVEEATETAEEAAETAEEAVEEAAEETAEETAEATEEAKESLEEMVEAAKEINSEQADAQDEKEKKSPFSFFFDIASIVSLATIIVGLAFIFLFRTVGVEGSSMYPTLHDKDRIILSAFVIEPKTGDIVVTCQPSAFSYIESTLVKRVIATEGQSVDIDFTEGIVYVDGVALDEPYVNELTHDRESFEPLTVPEDYVFVMGDNRNASTDSRDYRVGLIREDYIMGKALFRISPPGQFKIG